MHRSRTVIASSIVACLLIAGRAPAQVSLPGLLNSQVQGSDLQTGLEQTLTAPFRSGSDTPGISISASHELTIHSDRRNVGVINDLHASDRDVSGILPLAAGKNAPRLCFDVPSVMSGGSYHESGTVINAAGQLQEPAARLVWYARGGDSYYAGLNESDLLLKGATNLYNNLFAIFPTNPPFRIEQRTFTLSIGAVQRIRHNLSLEATLDRSESPGTLSLQNEASPTELSLPLENHGLGIAGTLRFDLSSGSHLYAFGSNGHYKGAGTVDREEERPVGTGAAWRADSEAGFGWVDQNRSGRTLCVYCDTVWTRWALEGVVPDPSQIGSKFANADDLNYRTGYGFEVQSTGLKWRRLYRANHRLELDYSYVVLRANLEADYSAKLYYFLPVGSENSTQPWAERGHLLEVHYTFPFARLESTISASQGLPAITSLSLSGHSSAAPSGPPSLPGKPGSISSSGGWALQWSVSYPF